MKTVLILFSLVILWTESVLASGNHVIIVHPDVIDGVYYPGNYTNLVRYELLVTTRQSPKRYLMDLYLAKDEKPFRLSFATLEGRKQVENHLKNEGDLDLCPCLSPDLETLSRYNYDGTRWRKAQVIQTRNLCDYGQVGKAPAVSWNANISNSKPPTESLKHPILLSGTFNPQQMSLSSWAEALSRWPYKSRVVYGATGPQIVQKDGILLKGSIRITTTHVDSSNSDWRANVNKYGTATQAAFLKCPYK